MTVNHFGALPPRLWVLAGRAPGMAAARRHHSRQMVREVYGYVAISIVGRSWFPLHGAGNELIQVGWGRPPESFALFKTWPGTMPEGPGHRAPLRAAPPNLTIRHGLTVRRPGRCSPVRRGIDPGRRPIALGGNRLGRFVASEGDLGGGGPLVGCGSTRLRNRIFFRRTTTRNLFAGTCATFCGGSGRALRTPSFTGGPCARPSAEGCRRKRGLRRGWAHRSDTPARSLRW